MEFRQMKKYLILILFFVVTLLTGMSLRAREESATTLSPLKQELAKLSSQLSLTQPQIAEVERILNMIYKQAEKDGESFKTSPDALIGAAKRRLLMQDNLMENLLSPKQKTTFRQLKKERINRFEFTIWKDGLRLTQLQCLKLTVILNNTTRELMGLKERMRLLSEQQRGLMDGSTRDRQRYNQTGIDTGQGREFRLSAAIDTIKQYKAKEIKKMLTKEQKKSFKKVKTIVDRELHIMEKKQLQNETMNP